MNTYAEDGFVPSDQRIRIQTIDDIIEMFRWFISDIIADNDPDEDKSFEHLFARFCRESVTENAVLDAVQELKSSFEGVYNEMK